MKKNLLKFSVTTMAGVVLLSTAFALPALAKSDFDSMKDVVFTKAAMQTEEAALENVELRTAPATRAVRVYPEAGEVAGDFYFSHGGSVTLHSSKDEPESGFTTTSLSELIELSDEQKAPYVQAAKQQIKETFGVDLPENVEFTATSYDFEGAASVYLNCSLPKDTELTEGMAQYYSAVFSDADIEKGTGKSSLLSAFGENKIAGIDALAKKAVDEYKNQLGIEITDDLSFDSSVNVVNGNTTVHFNWYNKGQLNAAIDPLSSVNAPFYNASFDNVDLENGTGDITSLESGFFTVALRADSATPLYSDEEYKIMEDAARDFAAKQNIQLGEVKQKLEFKNGQTSGLVMTFQSEDENTIRITVSEDGKVLGYSRPNMSSVASGITIRVTTKE